MLGELNVFVLYLVTGAIATVHYTPVHQDRFTLGQAIRLE